MKNNFKFRVWDFSKKKFYFYSGIFNLANQHQKLLPPGSFEQFNKIEIQQYVGLKDKKGEEIFIGDILKIDDCKYPAEVHFCNTCFRVNTEKEKSFGDKNELLEEHIYMDDLGKEWIYARVIGNIFENPELLK